MAKDLTRGDSGRIEQNKAQAAADKASNAQIESQNSLKEPVRQQKNLIPIGAPSERPRPSQKTTESKAATMEAMKETARRTVDRRSVDSRESNTPEATTMETVVSESETEKAPKSDLEPKINIQEETNSIPVVESSSPRSAGRSAANARFYIPEVQGVITQQPQRTSAAAGVDAFENAGEFTGVENPRRTIEAEAAPVARDWIYEANQTGVTNPRGSRTETKPGLNPQQQQIINDAMRDANYFDTLDNRHFYVQERLDENGKPNLRSDDENIREHFKTLQESEDYSTEFPNERERIDDDYRTFEGEGYTFEEASNPDTKKKRLYNMRKNEEAIQDFYKTAALQIESQSIDKETGEIRYNPRVEDAYMRAATVFGLSRANINRMVILVCGLGVDKDGNIVNEDWHNFKLTDKEFIDAIDTAIASLREHGHPFGLVSRHTMKIGGTNCYPVPAPAQMIDALIAGAPAESRLYGKSRKYVARAIHNTWWSQTAPTLRGAMNSETISQQYAIETMVRAISNLDGINASEYYGVRDMTKDNYDEILEAIEREKQQDKDNAEVLDRKKNELTKARERVDKRYSNRVKRGDGALNYNEVNKSHRLSTALHMLATAERICGIAGNVPLIVSGWGEHLLAVAYQTPADFVNRIMSKDGNLYKPTVFMKEAAMSTEGVDAMKGIKYIIDVGDMDVARIFADGVETGKYMPTEEGAKKCLLDIKNDPNTEASRLQKVETALNNIVRQVIPGDIGFGGVDAKRFLSAYMTNLSITDSADRKAGDRTKYLTADVAEQMIEADGIGNFMVRALETPEGRDAFVAVTNQTFNRISPLGRCTELILKANGVTDFVLTNCLDTYIKYGVNAVQLMIPYSNTLSWLATKGVANVYSTATNGERLELLDYQLGGNDPNGRGFLKNVIYDTVKFGALKLSGVFLGYLFTLLGFEPPEEEGLKYNIHEYAIAGQKIKMAWWTEDMTGSALPLAYATANYIQTGDLDTSIGIFWTACRDVLEGTSVLDLISTIKNAGKDMEELQKMAEDPNYAYEFNLGDEMTMAFDTLVANTIQKLTPYPLRFVAGSQKDTFLEGEGKTEANPFKTYDENGNEIRVTNPIEAHQRQLAARSPAYALMQTINGQIFGSEAKNWFSDQMPRTVYKDPEYMSYDWLGFDEEDVPLDEEGRWIFYEQKTEEFINYVNDNFGTPSNALAQGLFIPQELRKAMIRVAYRKILLAQLDYVTRSQNGEYPEYLESKEAQLRMQKEVTKWYDFLEDWPQNKIFPWKDEGYEQLLTSYDHYWVDKETGEVVDGLYAWMNSDRVEKVSYAYGDHPAAWKPFTTVDKTNAGYNEETIPIWYKEGVTDTESLFSRAGGIDMPLYSKYAGDTLQDVIFGGQPSGEHNIAPTEAPTLNRRGLVAKDEDLQKELDAITIDSVAAELGIDKEALDNYDPSKQNSKAFNNYGGYTRRSSGGGGSYNPKIYSNQGKSISAPKATTMYANKNRSYGSTTSYLRPEFTTKGSREAYRRSDY